jgi:hypothetical protein
MLAAFAGSQDPPDTMMPRRHDGFGGSKQLWRKQKTPPERG